MPLKYIFYDSNEENRKLVHVTYYTGDEEFIIQVKGEYFNGDKFKTSDPILARKFYHLSLAIAKGLGSVAEHLINQEITLRNREFEDAVESAISDHPDRFTEDDCKILGISPERLKKLKTSKKFNI